MTIKQNIFRITSLTLKSAIKLFGKRRAALISAQLAEELIPIIDQKTDFGTLSFYSPGKITEWRVRTLLTKEPKTIEWINTFSEGNVLWDIGANIGTYSLYAALKNVNVISFEPSAANYHLLCKNVEINKMDDKISAICLAFNDTSKLDYLYMSNSELSGANHSFAEGIDYMGNPLNTISKQAMIGFSIDDFVETFNPAFPDHIKIDVDGIESKIILGARKTLSDLRLKSILIELDVERVEYCNNVIKILNDAGLRLAGTDTDKSNQKNSLNFDHYLFHFIRQ